MWYSGQSRGGCRLAVPNSNAASWKAITASRLGAANAKWLCRLGIRSVAAPIQNTGWSAPYPTAGPTSISMR